MEYIICPDCNQDIEKDSHYCDQCGREIKVCKLCGKAGKKKHCSTCGVEMVAVKDLGKTNPNTQFVSNQVNAPIPEVTTPTKNVDPVPIPAPVPVSPQAEITVKVTNTEPAKNNLKLICSTINVTITGEDGVVIGRRNGKYAAQLAIHDLISGSHAKLEFKNGIWYITDLGSTNGTMINGNRLNSNVAYPLAHNSIVKIATAYDFVVVLS